MRRNLVVLLFLNSFFVTLRAQDGNKVPDLSTGDYVIVNPEEDTIRERDRASQTLRMLRNGSVIVRLKTNQRSVDAYRKAGRQEVADRIEESRRQQNKKLYDAFTNNFLFCKVYFIYAHDTEKFLSGNKSVFLNQELEYDLGIQFSDTTFVFCEYGSVESFSKFQDYTHPVPATGGSSLDPRVKGSKIFDTIPTRTSTSPATSSGLVFLDKDLQQLHRPFPFVEGVYLDRFDASVRTLNRELERAYSRLVVMRDYRENMKRERKRQKQLLRQYQ